MQRLRSILLLIFTVGFGLLKAQVLDDFSDGDFTANPVWSGDAPEWEILGGRLHLNAPAVAATSHLSTPSVAINNATWEFNVELTANPSSTNFVEIFLTSDLSNLEGPATGYLVRCGNTTDEISLYYCNAGTKTEIIDGLDGRLNITNPIFKVKVTRTAGGFWELYTDMTGTGTAYALEGSINHTLSTTSNYFGVLTTFTSTRNTWCFFDSVEVTGTGDVTPPLLLGATALSSTVAELTFDEKISVSTGQNTTNYLLNGTNNPISAQIQGPDSARVWLTFGTPFTPFVVQTVAASSIGDLSGNVMSTSGTANFTYAPLTPGNYKSVVINEIMADNSPAPICLPAVDYLELHNRSGAAINLQGWAVSDGAAYVTLTNSTFVVNAGDYVLLALDTSGFSNAPLKLQVLGFPNFNTTGDPVGIRSSNFTLIDSVSYLPSWYRDPVKDDGGWSLELINPGDTCPGSFNWIASNGACGGTPGLQNSVFSASGDTTAPSIVSVLVTGSSTLDVCFSEDVDALFATNSNNYIANNGLGSPISVVQTSPACVTLTFGASITSGVLFTLTATGLEDCQGNTAPSSLNFIQTGPAFLKAVVFNEIFPDPDSALTNMPPVEYVELYNRSSSIFNLSGWTFADPSTSVNLPNKLFFPGDYVLICKVADTAWFSGLNLLPVVALPSLNNAGDELGLRDASGNLVDTVSYSIAWYQDPIKDNGGWSLELINPGDTCSLTGNWIASNDVDGGTPGTVNSVLNNSPDLTPPSILSLAVQGPNVLEICFNETMDAGTLTNASFFSVNNGIGNPISAVPVGALGACVTLTFPSSFLNGTLYTLTVNGVSDCKGNATTDSEIFLQSGPAFPKEVVINEIYADPDSALTNMPPVEFVELYNRSNTYYNLGGWTLSDAGTGATVGDFVLAPGAFVVLCPIADTAFFRGLPALGMTVWPSLNNSGDQLTLKDLNGTKVDSVAYSLSWYQDSFKDDGGWTLELINPEDFCSINGNWIASNDPDGGTPGTINSVFNVSQDTTGPSLAEISILNRFSIQVCFSEAMDVGSLGFLANYSVNNGLGGPISALPSADRSCVDLVFVNPIDTGTVYTLSLSGLTDCIGNLAGTLSGDFVQGGASLPFQVVINEIFADESPVVGSLPEGEWIELVNTGTTVVDLNNWVLTDRRDQGVLGGYNLLPGAHVILCTSGNATDLEAFGPVVVVAGMPGLNNSGDSLEIYDANGNLIDWVYYSDAWYRDEIKQDGGWSLERLDASYSCFNGENWVASNHPNGATPGQPNSVANVFQDTTAPRVIGAILSNPALLRVYFDELMDAPSLSNPSFYTIDNGIGNPITATPVGAIPFAVDLTLPQPLDTNRIYCVTVSGPTDYPGNSILVSNSICFGIPVQPEMGDIVINEILFNPYTGGADFVELYNVSDKIIDIATLNLGEIVEGTDSIFNDDPISTISRLLLPQSYLAITPDRQFQLDTYFPLFPENILEMSAFPSFDDDAGSCVVFTDSGSVLDRLDYLDDWHFPNLDDKEGVSLERHRFAGPTQDPDNWHSAASNVRYATPGYKNSQVLDGGNQTDVWIFPETFSPDQDGQDDVISINYQFETSGWNVRLTIFDNQGREVIRLQENTLIGTDRGAFTWDGINVSGAKADVGVYVVLFEATQPSTGDKRHYKIGFVLAGRI